METSGTATAQVLGTFSVRRAHHRTPCSFPALRAAEPRQGRAGAARRSCPVHQSGPPNCKFWQKNKPFRPSSTPASATAFP